jgi:hypothetical protein
MPRVKCEICERYMSADEIKVHGIQCKAHLLDVLKTHSL